MVFIYEESKECELSSEDNPDELVSGFDSSIEVAVNAKPETFLKTDTARAIAEIDNVLRVMCSVDEQGRGQCETCPYREHFFTNGELHFSHQ